MGDTPRTAACGWEMLEEIRRIKARYFRFVDTRDWQGLAGLFAVDARFDRGFGHVARNPVTGSWDRPEPAPVIVSGREAIVAMIRAAVADRWTVHQGFMPELALTGPDSATGIWAMADELRSREGTLLLAGRGHYHDEYRREEGIWRITYSRLTRLHITRT